MKVAASIARLVSGIALGSLTACAGPRDPSTAGPPESPPAARREAEWEDAFDTTPDLLVVVFPGALRSDAVYGPLLRRAIELARERSPFVGETRALDAMEDADEIIFATWAGAARADGDVVVVVRGVRGDIDPAALVDSEGRLLWSRGPAGPVRELVREGSAPAATAATAATVAGAETPGTVTAASLFELPGRTWVIASGTARTRARAAFGRPEDVRRRLRLDLHSEETLARVRLDGPSLVARVPALGRVGGLGAIGDGLGDVTLDLASAAAAAGAVAGQTARGDGGGSGGMEIAPERVVKATLSYETEDAAAVSAATARQVIDAIGRKQPEGLAWLSGVHVDVRRAGKRLVLTAPLPPNLADALLRLRNGRARL